MRMQSAVLSFVFLILAFGTQARLAYAHSDHAHEPVTQSQAEKVATENVAKLIAAGKLDQSWKTVTVAKTEQKDFSGTKEWVVSFRNSAVSDPAKQTLYIFLNLGGEYLAANFTGK